MAREAGQDRPVLCSVGAAGLGVVPVRAWAGAVERLDPVVSFAAVASAVGPSRVSRRLRDDAVLVLLDVAGRDVVPVAEANGPTDAPGLAMDGAFLSRLSCPPPL